MYEPTTKAGRRLLAYEPRALRSKGLIAARIRDIERETLHQAQKQVAALHLPAADDPDHPSWYFDGWHDALYTVEDLLDGRTVTPAHQ